MTVRAYQVAVKVSVDRRRRVDVLGRVGRKVLLQDDAKTNQHRQDGSERWG